MRYRKTNCRGKQESIDDLKSIYNAVEKVRRANSLIAKSMVYADEKEITTKKEANNGCEKRNKLDALAETQTDYLNMVNNFEMTKRKIINQYTIQIILVRHLLQLILLCKSTKVTALHRLVNI